MQNGLVLNCESAFRKSPSKKLLYRLKTSYCLVTGDFHDGKVAYSCSAYIRDYGVAEIMKVKILNFCPATGRIKCCFDGINRMSLDQEDVILPKLADFIQVP